MKKIIAYLGATFLFHTGVIMIVFRDEIFDKLLYF